MKMAPHPQDIAHDSSIKDPHKFWSHQAAQLTWQKPPSETIRHWQKRMKNGVTHLSWTWFPDGEISTSYNCVDRHVKAGHGDNIAIIWDSPVTNQKQQYTYAQLLEEVETLAGALRQEGVDRGDVVLVYLPMIPVALIALLAISRLGAVHAVVFGGFSAPSLAQRIEGCTPKVIMTASCGIEGQKGPTSYKPMINGAIEKSSFKPERVIVWQRDELRWEPINRSAGERNWNSLVRSCKSRKIKADAVPVRSDDPVYIIYTSGTTGLPKGVQRETAGHLVGLNLSIKYCYGIRGPGDVMFTASDIGWVVGHSYILYAPLLAGATTVIFEGKPIGTPNAGTFWRILKEHKVNVMFTAPTALRAIRREDPDSKFFRAAGAEGGLRHFRALFLAGERSEPSIVIAYQKLLKEFCASQAQVIDNWWSSETGSPITSLALMPAAGGDFKTMELEKPLPIRPGSAGKPMPGFDVLVVNDEGDPVPTGIMGNIVLRLPLAPTVILPLQNTRL